MVVWLSMGAFAKATQWRSGRVVYRTCLENKSLARDREFESHLLRQLLTALNMSCFLLHEVRFELWYTCIKYMKLTFAYDEEKDIECLLSKGGGSKNSPGQRTKTYDELLLWTSNLQDQEEVKNFVRDYIQKNKLDIQQTIINVQKNWDGISERFEICAERVFGVKITYDITAYLTITGRYPYNIQDKFFYVSAKKQNANETAMHELWHFYTWLAVGDREKEIGAQKYNDIKEALTVLLNTECKDLMGDGIDNGYPQHAGLRNMILNAWKKTKDIKMVWAAMDTHHPREN